MKKHLTLMALIISSFVFNVSFAMEEVKKSAEKGNIGAMMRLIMSEYNLFEQDPDSNEIS